MKRITIGLVLLASIMLLLNAAAYAEPNMKEGTWEVKGEMKLEGMPFPMPPFPVNYSQCLTKKDLVPQQKEKNKDCKTINQKIAGNTVTWTAKCTDKNGAITDQKGSITYKGNSFESKIRSVTTDAHGAKTESLITMAGKRTGDCK